MHLHMRRVEPSVYLDLCVLNMTAQKTAVGKRAILRVTFNAKNNFKILLQCTFSELNKTGKYLATVQFRLPTPEINLPKTIMIVRHIVYSSQKDIPATWKISGGKVSQGMSSNYNYLAFTLWVTERPRWATGKAGNGQRDGNRNGKREFARSCRSRDGSELSVYRLHESQVRVGLRTHVSPE